MDRAGPGGGPKGRGCVRKDATRARRVRRRGRQATTWAASGAGGEPGDDCGRRRRMLSRSRILTRVARMTGRRGWGGRSGLEYRLRDVGTKAGWRREWRGHRRQAGKAGLKGAHGETATRGWTKRRESSSFWYGGLVGDEITLDCSDGVGPVHRDPLDSQPADRLEEAYR